MPKKVNQITKSQRLEVIRTILERRGRLNKAQIDEALSHHFEFDKESFSRTIYRDLAELVDNNEVQIHYYSKDNTEIDEFDDKIHKNYNCEWSVIDNSEKIKGYGLLKKMNGHLLSSERLNRLIEINSHSDHSKMDMINIQFLIANFNFKIQIPKDGVPFNLILGRLSAQDSNLNNHFVQAEKVYGKRTILLSIPYSTVSSFKQNSNQVGHCILKFENGLVFIEDFASKNGTFFSKLKTEEIDKIQKKLMASQKTLTSDSARSSHLDVFLERVLTPVPLSSSSLVQLGDEIQICVSF